MQCRFRQHISGSTRLLCAILLLGLLLPLDARVELQPCKNNVPPQQQIALGDKVAQQVYQQMPVLPDTSAETKYIRDLGRKLAAEAPGYKWPYNFHVVNVADINAFALPGGSVFVNLGTVQAASNEAELAAVMAHEISHVVLQHSVCNAEKQKRVGLIAGIGQIAAGVLLGGAGGELAQEVSGLPPGSAF
ncbi:MAG: M48 family metalloprotease [Acidobacteriaceae bacterium]|nr:M48 family metalloprotease [Acidobacteriaceae bacterium]